MNRVLQLAMVPLSALVLFLSGCDVIETAASWDGPKDTVRKSFEVASGGQLTVDSDLGSIEVQTQTSNRVDVEVIRQVRDDSSRSALDELDLSIVQSGNNVNVSAKLPHGSNWFRHNRLRLSFIITVPRSYNVDLKTSGGSIKVADLEGRVLAKTSGGGLDFGQIVGPVEGKTSGGSIRLQSSRGTADIRTSGGGIDIGDVEGDVAAETSGGSISIEQARGRVHARTSGGGIDVNEVFGEIDASTSGGSVSATIMQQPSGDCRLSTSGGGIEVRMAENIGFDVDAKTSGGRVRADFPISVQVMEKNEMRGPVNGGGPQLFLRTSGGNISLEKANR